jgi:hypothetical protein
MAIRGEESSPGGVATGTVAELVHGRLPGSNLIYFNSVDRYVIGAPV